ncbi:MAG TPA: FAD-dependent oxidoreductase [Spirochaetota bacterium]|nr:FAD-dependent oxidoreductase [Spirochaetota bacterium]HNT09456.1 FAD-dependent oxidoreductase [Spirochaetota bacterium]
MKQAVVIGGGVVGCHIALELAERRYEVFLLERHSRLGMDTSTRNSGVLHAGIYYPADSLKARLCVEGNRLSREFFDRTGVQYRPSGKFIIARDRSEISEIEALRDKAIANGAEGISLVPQDTVQKRVPYVRCVGALHSASTCIIDTGDYLTTLKTILMQRDVHLLYECPALAIDGGVRVETPRGSVDADIVINAAGLYADEVARMTGLDDFTVVPLKGDYYCTTALPLEVPVYPSPNHGHGTLGVHLTPTCGPDVIIGPSETPSRGKDNYDIETPFAVFDDSLRDMIPNYEAIRPSLREGFSGNRPRAFRGGTRCEDFIIMKQPDSVIHLLSIESPGLTSAPAIARFVVKMI